MLSQIMARSLIREVLLRVRAGSSPAILVVAVFFHAPKIAAQEPAARPAFRDVTPSGITRVYGSPIEPEIAGELRRTFNNVRVLSDGKIRSGSVAIRLYGAVLPERNKLCVAPSGARWACGVSAIGALRNLIQSRSIDCVLQGDTAGEDEIVGLCRIGRTEISLRLLEQGWAMPDQMAGEKAYADAAEFGRQKGLGLWADGPPSGR
jgi:endonuclease YncB( thermonuclease family)